MKAAGIICEYNPVHTGHVRHIAETRALVGSDCAVVCVMSGNVVQRGDFAVFAKHARAASAIAAGADLVLELPLVYVLSSAEGFARGGVRLLNALGVITHLSFGSEAGEIPALREEFWSSVRIPGEAADFNQELEKALRLADFLELAQLIAEDALHREESCGGHFRE